MVWTDFNRNMPDDFQQTRRDTPSLKIEEIAEVVLTLLSLPDHVDVGELVVQLSAKYLRRPW